MSNVNNYRLDEKGIAEIWNYEGCCLSPYYDSVGVLTIFVGHTAAAGAPNPRIYPMDIDQPWAVALQVFKDDISDVENDVNRLVTVRISQTQFNALVSFHFNTGGLGRSTLLKKLNAGDVDGAIAEFDKWHIPVEITGRRNNEKKLFSKGIYSGNGKCAWIDADENGRVHYGREVDVLKIIKDIEGNTAPTPSRPAPVQVPTPVPSATRGKTFTVSGTGTSGLNLRSAPNTQSTIVRGLPEGRQLSAVDTKDWTLVTDIQSGVTGWVASRYLKETA